MPGQWDLTTPTPSCTVAVYRCGHDERSDIRSGVAVCGQLVGLSFPKVAGRRQTIY